jgi:hypothetical protein
MSLKKAVVPAKSSAATTNQPKADGWANLSITDANQNNHRFPKGVALFDEEQIHRSMLNKLRAAQKAAAEAGQDIPTTMSFTLTATVSLAKPEEELSKDIPL